jgi:peptidoglycan-associated lipoprotein
MKKYGVYSLLLAAILFTGCSQKNVEIDGTNGTNGSNGNANSESSLNNVSESNSKMDGSMSEGQNPEDGNYLMIAGKKVLVKNIYFAFDKYNLDDKNREQAKSNAVSLSSLEQNVKIKLEGNSDEWGTDEYNYALSLKRAKAVKNALVADGISSSSITMVSFGESNPTCTDKTVECWKKNRRVEYKLLP